MICSLSLNIFRFKSLSVKEKHKKEDENWTAAENKTLDAGAKILDK